MLFSDAEIIIIKSRINEDIFIGYVTHWKRESKQLFSHILPYIRNSIKYSDLFKKFSPVNASYSESMFSFTVEVGLAQRNFNIKSPVDIIAHLNVIDYIERYKAISNARECPLFDAVITPHKLRRFCPNGIGTCRLGIEGRKRVSLNET